MNRFHNGDLVRPKICGLDHNILTVIEIRLSGSSCSYIVKDKNGNVWNFREEKLGPPPLLETLATL
jgi:hypothetical protein